MDGDNIGFMDSDKLCGGQFLYQLRQEPFKLAEENLEAAELNLELSRERYENGSLNSFNYRDVQQIYLNAAVQYENAIFSVISSYMSFSGLGVGLLMNSVHN